MTRSNQVLSPYSDVVVDKQLVPARLGTLHPWCHHLQWRWQRICAPVMAAGIVTLHWMASPLDWHDQLAAAGWTHDGDRACMVPGRQHHLIRACDMLACIQHIPLSDPDAMTHVPHDASVDVSYHLPPSPWQRVT